MSTGRPSSRAAEVMRTPEGRRGPWPKTGQGIVELMARPWVVTKRATWMPMEAILRSATHRPRGPGGVRRARPVRPEAWPRAKDAGDEGLDPKSQAAQVDHGIDHQLAGFVGRGPASPVGLDHGHAGWRGQDWLRSCAPRVITADVRARTPCSLPRRTREPRQRRPACPMTFRNSQSPRTRTSTRPKSGGEAGVVIRFCRSRSMISGRAWSATAVSTGRCRPWRGPRRRIRA
jgi:hypothetical protein